MLVVASKYRIELSEAEGRELRRRAGQYTRSHREVLRAKIVLLANEGLSNAEIAANLHLSIPTVKTHVSRLLAKLNGRDRVQLVVIAYETGVASRGQHRP